jgi:hypothetical protein
MASYVNVSNRDGEAIGIFASSLTKGLSDCLSHNETRRDGVCEAQNSGRHLGVWQSEVVDGHSARKQTEESREYLMGMVIY